MPPARKRQKGRGNDDPDPAAAVCDAETIAAMLTAFQEEAFPEPLDEHDPDADFWTERRREYLTQDPDGQTRSFRAGQPPGGLPSCGATK